MKDNLKALLLSSILLLMGGIHCIPSATPPVYITQRVVIIVVDGPRFTETWDEPNRYYIPTRNGLLKQGVMCQNFYNEGVTYTNNGHAAISTGVYDNLDNWGSSYPANPSIFQYYLKQKGLSASKCQLITSKDKLSILANCNDSNWAGKYMPETDCGNGGAHSGYRDDAVTYAHVIQTLSRKHPNLVLVNFQEPDASGHSNNWSAYINGIRKTDEYIGNVWKYLQQDPYYKGKTTLMVTNDHGRHLDGVFDGFISHGCTCEGCRRIEFFAIGPDFKENYTSTKTAELTDVAATVGELLGFKATQSNGRVMKELFK